MKDVDPNRLLAWLAIIVLAVGWVVTGTSLFNRVDSQDVRITKLEKKDEEREAEQKTRDTEQRKRDEALSGTLGQIRESVNFANWNIKAIDDKLKEKKR